MSDYAGNSVADFDNPNSRIYNYTDELKIGGQSESQIPHILIRVIN